MDFPGSNDTKNLKGLFKETYSDTKPKKTDKSCGVYSKIKSMLKQIRGK